MSHWRRYPKYKPSGVEWLGEVPEGWDLQRAKLLFRKMNRMVRENDEIVTAFRDGEVTLRTKRRTEGFTNSLQEIGYQGIRKGDLVIHGMDGFAGAIGVSDSDGKSTPVYSVCLPFYPNKINNHYFARLLRHAAMTGFIQSLAKGIRERSTEFRFDELGQLFLPIFSLEEQEKIVAFLNREIVSIDTLILKKVRQIELLEEKRVAFINYMVTKGLDPNAKMKDSGIEWIGNVPEHWEVISLKRKWNVVDCKHITAEYVDDGIPVVSTTEVKPGKLSLENTRKTTEKDYQNSIDGRRPKKGDIVYSRNASLGSAAYVDTDEKFCMGQDVCLITSDLNNQLFLMYQLNCPIVVHQIESQMIGSTIKRINVEQIKELKITYPPNYEQQELAKFLDFAEQDTEYFKKRIKQSINLLKEYRSTLISAAVTGKIDVRAEAR
jgi:type I restriction enzyme, S subunit